MRPPTRRIEIFSAGCPACRDAIDLVERIRCDACEVVVRDVNDPEGMRRARAVGAASFPAVAVDGVLAACCAGRGPDEDALRAIGIGSAAP